MKLVKNCGDTVVCCGETVAIRSDRKLRYGILSTL
jgi:hypothetical protein